MTAPFSSGLDFDTSRPPSPYLNESHHAWRAAVRRFVDREVAPHVNAWDEAAEFPRDLYKKAAEVGLIGLGYPEEWGGAGEGTDVFHMIIAAEELARAGCGGVAAGLMSHGIGLPPVIALGSEELKARVAPPVLAGEKIAALAITEPSGGSDVANLKTKAVRDGDAYVLNGEKTFITSGVRADFLTVAARTGGPGASGVSLFVVEGDAPGLARTKLDKMGWWASDTATLHFDDVRVPATNLIGAENQGFLGIMLNFNNERLSMAASMTAFSRVCLEDAVAWAKARETFGKPLAKHQVIRHKIAEMYRAINATQAYLEACAWRVMQGETPVADLSLLKVQASQTMEFCAREAMQILGGAGFMRGCRVERIYREVRVNAIGGGSEEILRDLAARQLGL